MAEKRRTLNTPDDAGAVASGERGDRQGEQQGKCSSEDGRGRRTDNGAYKLSNIKFGSSAFQQQSRQRPCGNTQRQDRDPHQPCDTEHRAAGAELLPRCRSRHA